MKSTFQAIRLNELENYKNLIEKEDINIVNEDGQGLLHEAISHNNTFIGLDLIWRGIDINKQDNNGQTALHFAASFSNEELAKAIVKAGGNPNIRDNHGNNALWTAVFNARGKYNIVKIYKEAGGDSLSKNNAGRTPLDFSKQIKDESLIALLQ